MTRLNIPGWRWLLMMGLWALTGCLAAPRPAPMGPARHYVPPSGEGLPARLAPAFWVEEAEDAYNRPGTVRATTPETVFIDPDKASLYVEKRTFSTSRGDYLNLLYRVHFREIPYVSSPYFLGAGKNIGLFVIVTLDVRGAPLLVTTVHTCGCYLAFIPTSNLPESERPDGWGTGRQSVYGESLPTLLDYGGANPDQRRIQIRLRPGNHRVMDVWLASVAEQDPSTVPLVLRPLDHLKRLPMESGGTTSFYVSSGPRAGHVKGSFKPRERLWMSWWTFAWDIGQDKYLGKDIADGPVFFTSLLPWARAASDLRDFASFLRYWGWQL